MAQRRLREERFHSENIFAFPRVAPVSEGAASALDLVYQAAEIFRAMEGTPTTGTALFREAD